MVLGACGTGQASPRDTISLIYDDRRLLETRVRRLASPRIYSQEPRSRTSRIIANVTIEEAAADACTVRSKFQLLEYRRETQRIFGGTLLAIVSFAGQTASRSRGSGSISSTAMPRTRGW